MGAEAPSDLLDDRSLYVALPFLYLNGHSRPNDITDNQSATNIDTAILAAIGNLDFLETHLCQESCNQFLKGIPLCFKQPFMQRLPHFFVVLFDFKGEPPTHPFRKANKTFAMLNKSRLLPTTVKAFNLR